MDVNGLVLGNPKINSSIHLYNAEGLDYESIVAVIKEETPERTTYVNTNRSFSFHCLQPGLYLVSVSAASFDYSVGAPIATKSRNDGLEVDTILNGGNSQYLFSAFSIKQIP